MTGLDLMAAAVSRPVFEGIGPAGKAIFYAAAAISTVLFAWGVWLRVRKYRIGSRGGALADHQGGAGQPPAHSRQAARQ